jgi:GNAT superfamily N-acetyltransferase
VVEHVIDWGFLARRAGWRPLIFKVRDVVRTLPRRRLRYIVMGVALDSPFPVSAGLENIEVRPFIPSDLHFVRREHLPSEAAMCARRLAAGQEGLTAVLDGEPAGYAWLCRNDALERVDLPMTSDEVMFTDAFTAPRFRGRGVNTSLALASLRWARELRYSRLIGYIEAGNGASLNVWLGKMGGRVFQRLEFERVWARRRTRRIEIRTAGPPGGKT